MKNNDVLQTILVSDDIHMITQKVAEYLQNPVVLISPSFQVIAYSNRIQLPDPAWQQSIQRGYITLSFGTILTNFDTLKKKDISYLDVDQISQFKRRFYQLHYNQQLVGYLNVSEWKTPFEQIEADDFELCAKILAKEMAIYGLQHPSILDQDVLLRLLHDGYQNQAHFQQVVQNTSLDKIQDYFVGCISLQSYRSYDALHDPIALKMKELFPSSYVIIDQQTLIMLSPRIRQYHTLLEYHGLLTFLKKNDLQMGISYCGHRLFDLSTYVQQAKIALSYHGSTPVIYYEQVHLKVFLDHLDLKQYQGLLHPQIVWLYQQDKQNDTQYTLTLYTYLQHDRHTKETANALFIHRNTLLYRLEKMEQDYHIRLNDVEMTILYRINCYLLLHGNK